MDQRIEKVLEELRKFPPKARALVAAHLLESLGEADLDLSPDAREALLQALPVPEGEDAISPAADLKSRQEALIKEFGIEVLGEGEVRLELNGTSRIDFLRKVQEVASELYRRPAIYGPRLNTWHKDPSFVELCEGKIAVGGNVEGSTYKTRAEKKAQGWNSEDSRDLAVAHAAYFLATGKDLFGGNVVRARDGALYFTEDGLRVFLLP